MKEAIVCTLFALGAHSAWACGKWRWSIKTGTDTQAQQIDMNKINQVTMSDLTALPLPVQPPKWNNYPQNSRIEPTELNVYNIHATIVGFRNEGDGDYHLIIQDSAGNSMDAEIPDPNCVGASSPFLPMIRAVRAFIDQNLSQPGQVNIPASITGVGFFDFPHAGGAAPNGIELHPVLKVQFLTSLDETGVTKKNQ